MEFITSNIFSVLCHAESLQCTGCYEMCNNYETWSTLLWLFFWNNKFMKNPNNAIKRTWNHQMILILQLLFNARTNYVQKLFTQCYTSQTFYLGQLPLITVQKWNNINEEPTQNRATWAIEWKWVWVYQLSKPCLMLVWHSSSAYLVEMTDTLSH